MTYFQLDSWSPPRNGGHTRGEGCIFLEKKTEKAHNKEAEFKEKEKRLFPIILEQHSPSLKLQIEGAPNFI